MAKYPITELEGTVDGGVTANATLIDNGNGTATIQVGDTAKAAGLVGARVKAAAGRNASDWLFNTVPFTTSIPNASPTILKAIADHDTTPGFTTFQVDLTKVFTDPDGDALTFTATSDNTALATVSVNNTTKMLTVTEAGGGTGAATVTVTANDGKGGSIADSFVITVLTEANAIFANWRWDQGVTNDGNGYMSQWSDTAAGKIIAQATAGSRPVIRTDSIDFVSSKWASATFAIPKNDATFFYRLQKGASTGVTAVLMDGGTQRRVMYLEKDTTRDIQAYDGAQFLKTGDQFTYDANFHTVTFIFSGLWLIVRLDGVEIHRGAIGDYFDWKASVVRYLSKSSTSSDGYNNAKLKGLRIYQAALSNADCSAVETALATL